MSKHPFTLLALLCSIGLSQSVAHADNVLIVMNGFDGQFYSLPQSGQGEVITYTPDPSLFACPTNQVCFFHQPDTIAGNIPDFDTFAFGASTYTDDGVTYYTNNPFITVTTVAPAIDPPIVSYTGNEYVFLPGNYLLSATPGGPVVGTLAIDTPEPESLLLLGTGALGVAATLRRKSRKV